MTMRIEVTWTERLDHDSRSRMLLAMAALSEVRRAVNSPDGLRTTLYATDVATHRIAAALQESGLKPASVTGSLAPDAEAALIAGQGERFRPIGR
jgi:hypothetical protein